MFSKVNVVYHGTHIYVGISSFYNNVLDGRKHCFRLWSSFMNKLLHSISFVVASGCTATTDAATATAFTVGEIGTTAITV